MCSRSQIGWRGENGPNGSSGGGQPPRAEILSLRSAAYNWFVRRRSNLEELKMSGLARTEVAHAGVVKRADRGRQGRQVARGWAWLLCLIAFATALPASVQAQTFRPVPALSFTKAFGGGDSLS